MHQNSHLQNNETKLKGDREISALIIDLNAQNLMMFRKSDKRSTRGYRTWKHCLTIYSQRHVQSTLLNNDRIHKFLFTH